MTCDLSANFLGLELKNPILAAASPLTSKIDSLLALQDAGVAGVVLPSMFEEQIEHDELEVVRLLDYWALSAPESPDYFPELNRYNTGPSDYLEFVSQAKSALDIPVIASLNGCSQGGWIRYAGLIEQAGADALELNIYQVPTDSQSTADELEREHAELVRLIARNVRLPLSIKIGPYFTALPHLAQELVKAGAQGLVLFNRFLAPDIELDSMQYVPTLELSTPGELRLALRWIAILRAHLDTSLLATGGVHSGQDIIKSLMAGADAVAMASALVQNGPAHLGKLLGELSQWLDEHEYQSLTQLRGCLSMQNCANPEALKRAHYTRALVSFSPPDA